ncbi:hypothetical protein LOK49_LG07G01071 [Camellia lanceoleosa]|uniref:Uncharacterized protein n=1 Tax=Camellia lanceoleosa TaxID=1840588 RepID=A0ACC0H1K4_9ERIC|nr:hypothetical protein LOK49_LG07G01071 [Camellia lanceoleosa]
MRGEVEEGEVQQGAEEENDESLWAEASDKAVEGVGKELSLVVHPLAVIGAKDLRQNLSDHAQDSVDRNGAFGEDEVP